MRLRKLRIAKPAVDLQKTEKFYCGLLGFEKLGHFEDHDGFDGLMVGHPELPYHFEFTIYKNNPVKPVTTGEDLIVFYIPESGVWEQVVERLEKNGHNPIPNHNPYWDLKGKSYEDPNGYHIVVQNNDWGQA